MNARVVVLAKVPTPGRVKTRLCPPCSPEQAARVAAAALADTVAAVDASGAATRVLATDRPGAAPVGWSGALQRGGPLGERLANAFADLRPALLIGMDTPQLTGGHLDEALRLLAGADAVFGPAEDGGWWALGLRDPGHAEVLRDIPTSTATTGARTRDALLRRGLRIAELPRLRDVDTAPDAYAVAALCPAGRAFPGAVAAEVPR
ncbi:TIGR04282 family arsenosugar biosynthesis glycosyltransferase [Actinoplanes sp. KI2]|uniref:TIGR04282 family arsenosugar biosynthesis glycosyltransferase n=1 Tax=Actinoplanes sp. KI2 TaxID=2983315 RepID=UPI0021D60B17|nr:TIGR04282 family arsenosugar biosynthesis glycosyltransferase [Actinoplanes sp. KI2]MCU7730106.1 TIGR04282 family arsenosugar biosynthesis glycosyltransferase [Actinoplanes sp. KI2]